MNITIVGIGKVGYNVAEQLVAEDHNVTLIDKNQAALGDADRELDVFCVCGNGAAVNTLKDSGIDNCDILIATTGSDELNLLCCCIAKSLGVSTTIARVRNPEYHDEIEIIRNALGLTMAVNPERIAALEMLRILKFPYANRIDVFTRGKINIVSFVVSKQCKLCNKAIRESFSGLSVDALACAVERGDKAFIPFGDTVLEERDTVAVLIPPADIQKFFKEIGMVTESVRNTMIIGGGKIAYYLAGFLTGMNINVTIVEKNVETAEQLSCVLPDSTIICGDGTDRTVLLEEGLMDMDAFCSVTGVDEENILLSLYAKSVVPNIKTITKVNRLTFREVIHDLPLDTVVYPKDTTTTKILKQVRAMENNLGSNVETLYKIINNKAEALEFVVNENCGLLGQTLEDLKLRKGVIIGSISRKNKPFIPHGKDYLKPGDSVVIVTTIPGLNDLDDIKE